MGTNDVLKIRSIREYQNEGVGGMIRKNLGSAWYFDKGYEKAILVVLCGLGLWKLVGFFL